MAGVGRWWIAAAITVVAAVLTGCASALAGGLPPPVASGPGPSRPSVRAATQPRRAGTGRPRHLIVMNHSFEQIIGSPAAPFINRLAAYGTLLTLHRPCSTVARFGAYTEAVDPFMHAADVRHYPARCDRVLQFRRFHADLAAGRLPTVAFVTPDLDHKMLSGPVRVADTWLQRLVGALRTNPVWRQDNRLVITFDESRGRDVRSCCDGLGRGGRILTIVAGPRVPRGRDPTPYTHYSLLRSIEAAVGPGFLRHAGDPATATFPAVADRSPGVA